MDRKALKGQLWDRLTCGEVKCLTFAASQTLPILEMLYSEVREPRNVPIKENSNMSSARVISRIRTACCPSRWRGRTVGRNDVNKCCRCRPSRGRTNRTGPGPQQRCAGLSRSGCRCSPRTVRIRPNRRCFGRSRTGRCPPGRGSDCSRSRRRCGNRKRGRSSARCC